MPFKAAFNLTSRDGITYSLSRTRLRNIGRTKKYMVFPFRSIVMFYPLTSENIQFSDLVKFSELACIGLDDEEKCKELFTIGTIFYDRGGYTINCSALDCFRAGIAGCGHLNNLIGNMLEINQIRYRIVSGFHPIIRQGCSGGGHSAIEVFVPNKGWSYLDSFMDIFLPGISAKDLSQVSEGDLKISFSETRLLEELSMSYLKLSDLFKYRIYADDAQRLPMAPVSQLLGREDTYGMDWLLRVVLSHEKLKVLEDIPENVTIFIRARYVKTKHTMKMLSANDIEFDKDALSSPWAYASFILPARSIVLSLLKGK